MRRGRITKADLEKKVSELMVENKYLLSMFEITARRHEALKIIVDKVQIEEKKRRWRAMFPSPAFKKTPTIAKIFLENGNDEAN